MYMLSTTSEVVLFFFYLTIKYNFKNSWKQSIIIALIFTHSDVLSSLKFQMDFCFFFLFRECPLAIL